MPPGPPPKRRKIDPSRFQDATFSLLNFDLVLGSILAPFWLPKCLPLGTLLALKINQKTDSKSDCLEGRSKVAPRAPKTVPRCPPDPPGEPQDPRRGLLDPPWIPQEALPDPLGRPKTFSEASGPITFFGKIENSKSPPDPPGRPKRLFRSTWPETFFRKFRNNQSRLFSEEALCTAVVGKSKNSK